MKLLFLFLFILITPAAMAAPADAAPQQAAPAAKPFRIIFSAYDGDPKNPKTMSFQINTVDLRQPSEFLKIGETVPNTNLRLLKFEQKLKDICAAEIADTSELSVINIQTKEVTVLILSKIQNLPSAAKNP